MRKVKHFGTCKPVFPVLESYKKQGSDGTVDQKPKKLHGCVTALLIFFWPAGVAYLIINMLNKDKNNYVKKANAITAFGVFLIICGIYYLIAGLTGNVDSEDPGEILYGIVTMLIFGCGGGFALLIFGGKQRKLGLLTRKYVPAIVDGGMEDMEAITQMANVSYEQAEADLQLLIGKGILKERYIDPQKRMLVWTAKPREEDLPKEKVICPHCGGTNIVTFGKESICEYCDSQI